MLEKSMNLPTDGTKSPREIEVQINDGDSIISAIEELIEILRKNISPVLAQENASIPKGDNINPNKESIMSSPLGATLYIQNKKLFRIKDSLKDLNEHIVL